MFSFDKFGRYAFTKYFTPTLPIKFSPECQTKYLRKAIWCPWDYTISSNPFQDSWNRNPLYSYIFTYRQNFYFFTIFLQKKCESFICNFVSVWLSKWEITHDKTFQIWKLCVANIFDSFSSYLIFAYIIWILHKFKVIKFGQFKFKSTLMLLSVTPQPHSIRCFNIDQSLIKSIWDQTYFWRSF